MYSRLYNEFKKASLEENRKLFRSSQGTGFVEVAAGFILVLLVIYLALDLFLVAQGCTLNTEIVKEAARVASMGTSREKWLSQRIE